MLALRPTKNFCIVYIDILFKKMYKVRLYDINTASLRALGPFFIFITSVLWCRWAIGPLRLVLLCPWYEERNIAMSMSVLCICLSVSKHPRNCTFSGHHFRACYLRPMLGPSHGGVAMRYFLPVFTARCYASAVLGMGLCLSVSVCLCLCLSQVVVLLKRLNTNNTTR